MIIPGVTFPFKDQLTDQVIPKNAIQIDFCLALYIIIIILYRLDFDQLGWFWFVFYSDPNRQMIPTEWIWIDYHQQSFYLFLFKSSIFVLSDCDRIIGQKREARINFTLM